VNKFTELTAATIDNTNTIQEDVIAFLDSQHMANLSRANIPMGMAQQQQDVPASKPASASIISVSLKNGGMNPSWTEIL